MLYNFMWHFIWVFTVCHSTHLGTSSPQRVNAWADPFFSFLFLAFKAVLDYLNKQNRPYSAIDICNNLHKEYGKTVSINSFLASSDFCSQLSADNLCKKFGPRSGPTEC